MYVRLAWRNIWRNRRRTWITASSIAFAVFFASLTQSMQLGSYERMIDNSVRFMTGHLSIHHEKYWNEKILDNSFYLKQLETAEFEGGEVGLSAPRLTSFALASFGQKTRGALITGVRPEKEAKFSYLNRKLIKGRYFEGGVMIAEGLAEYLELNIGDTIVFISQGYHGINAAGKYPVGGILKFPVPELNRSAVYMNLPQAQEFYGAYGLITAHAFLLKNPRALDEMYDRLSELVDADLKVRTWKQMMPELVEGIELDYYGGLIMIYVLYAIIGFGIFGTFLMMTRERTYEFGILTAIGMKKGKIRRMVALEILLISFLGVTIGLLLSAPILVYFHYNPIVFTGDYAEVFENFGYEPVLPFSLDAMVFYSQGVVVLLISLFLGLYPMWYIHQLRTVKALKA